MSAQSHADQRERPRAADAAYDAPAPEQDGKAGEIDRQWRAPGESQDRALRRKTAAIWDRSVTRAQVVGNHRCGDDEHGNPVFTDVTDRCLGTLGTHDLDALIVIGGDGSISCAAPFVEAGFNCIAVPKTIDNDVVGTDITFGFLTAAATATDALDRLHSTAMSHHRVMVCEVMGRNAGWIALHAGVASGSDVILIPEIPYDIEQICDFVQGRMHRSRGFSIIACAEGAKPIGGDQVVANFDPTSPQPVRLGGVSQRLASDIQERTGIESRTTILGYIQRSGTPVADDRVLATQFGYHAIELLMSGARDRMVVMRDGKLGDVDIRFAVGKQRLVGVDDPLVAAARAVKTCFGD